MEAAQLFLPADESSITEGFLIGWNPQSLMCTVCAVIDAPLEQLDAALSILHSRDSSLAEHCRGPPIIVGVILPPGGNFLRVRSRAEKSKFWLTLIGGADHGQPRLRSIHSNGDVKTGTPLQLIYYHRGQRDSDWRPRVSMIGLWDGRRKKESKSEFALALRHVGCSGEWHRALHAALHTLERKTPSKDGSSSHHRPPPLSKEHETNARLLLLLRGLSAPHLLALRTTAAMCLYLLRLPFLPSIAPIRWSFAARHAEARLARAIRWPHRFASAHAAPLWRATTRLERLSVYGELACGLIDSAIGGLLAIALMQHSDDVYRSLSWLLSTIHEETLPGLVKWLMGVDPGGFKLNENLNIALGSSVLVALRAWHEALSLLTLHVPSLLTSMIGDASLSIVYPLLPLLLPFASSLLGASVLISLTSDLLCFITLHIRYLYVLFGTIYSHYISALYSLFNLFRGKKYNVLRNRVDSKDYDTEQTLLGTLFFTVLFFLLPNVLAYHLLTYVLYHIVLTIQSALMLSTLLLEDFPWFELLTYVLRPRCLHSGIRLRPQGQPKKEEEDDEEEEDDDAVCFALEPDIADPSPCFARHGEVLVELVDHLSVWSLLDTLVMGKELLPPAEREILLERPPDRSPLAVGEEEPTIRAFWRLLLRR